MESIEKFDYKGYQIRIEQDETDYSPDESGDDGLFLVAFHSDFSVHRDGFEIGVCRSLLVDEGQSDEDIQRAKEVSKEYHVFELEAYIHSGVVLALSQEGNFPDRQWDVSRCGLVFASKKAYKSKTKAREAARLLIRDWNHCLGGECYGFVVEKEKTCKTCGHTEYEFVDSCGGFLGETEACIASAKDTVDGLVK